ncbi:MAG: hypothetical protein IT385_20590 [Deltaproteobacteria bacterium]|nr:hypothetical protein [Deltaproteobacteria bacterium]
MTTRFTSIIFVAAALAACGKDGDPSGPPDDGDARGFAITVSPLTYDPLTDAIYTLRLRHAGPPPNNVVWEQKRLSSQRYGDGRGGLAYVGPCSVADNPHTLELVIDDLVGAGGASLAGRFQNPAPPERPLLVTGLECVENGDVPVVVNLTIMRNAEQGFFDIVVNFEDIFCSAKLDCQRDGEPIELLFDPETGKRAPTFVLGFACTAGTDRDGEAEPTWLHMSDVVLRCDGAPDIYFEPDQDPGQHGTYGPDGQFFQTAIYRGEESLPDVDKCYWNMAFGVDLSEARNCHLLLEATASHESWAGHGYTTPPGAIFPYVSWDIPLTDDTGIACDQNPLNGLGSGVQTKYTTMAGAHFKYEWECDADADIDNARLECGELVAGMNGAFLPTPETVSATIGGVRSKAYRLPEGRYMGSTASCCANPCCAPLPD